ncbi:MAG: Minf_1886 family protein [Planctomycetota bacterium]
MEDRVRAIALADGRYSPEAFRFLLEGLERAIEISGRGALKGQARHVTGREVLVGLIDFARATFGPLAAQVWRSWGIQEPLDWGHVVFLMVDNGLLSRQDSDSIEDFRQTLDFDQEFVDGYRVELPTRL